MSSPVPTVEVGAAAQARAAVIANMRSRTTEVIVLMGSDLADVEKVRRATIIDDGPDEAPPAVSEPRLSTSDKPIAVTANSITPPRGFAIPAPERPPPSSAGRSKQTCAIFRNHNR